MRVDLVTTIVRNAPVQRFMIQTNGILLNCLDLQIVERFTTILVSIDGNETLTDGYRGLGGYRKVMDNIRTILSNGYKGELIGRMTVTECTDIIKVGGYLDDNPDHPFDTIHWQLDADFASDSKKRRFAEWISVNYNPGIRLLRLALG